MDFDSDDALSRYSALMAEMPRLFRNEPGQAVTILVEPEDIQAAKAAARANRMARGQITDDLRVGVLSRDPYMMLVRDAVRFMDGSLGLYNRIVEGGAVAVVPIYRRRLVLVEIFRHGARDWMLEFPRGGVGTGEREDDAARREIAEEIGGRISELRDLGRFTPGGSSIATPSRLFGARLDAIGPLDTAEGIRRVHLVSAETFEDLVRTEKIYCGFTISAFMRARVMGFL